MKHIRHEVDNTENIYVSLKDALALLGDSAELKDAVKAGKINVMITSNDTPPNRRDKKYKDLEKVIITSVEAAEEFNTTRATISRWIKAGYLKPVELGERGRSKMSRVRKADIAYISDLQEYRLKRNGTVRGYRLFDEDGKPILEMRWPDVARYRRQRALAGA